MIRNRESIFIGITLGSSTRSFLKFYSQLFVLMATFLSIRLAAASRRHGAVEMKEESPLAIFLNIPVVAGSARWWATDDGDMNINFSTQQALSPFPELSPVQSAGDELWTKTRRNEEKEDTDDAPPAAIPQRSPGSLVVKATKSLNKHQIVNSGGPQNLTRVYLSLVTRTQTNKMKKEKRFPTSL